MRRFLLATLLLLAACGGGGDDEPSSSTATGDDGPKATLGIITTEIETALGKAAFAEAEEGQQLDVGDRVRTDETGFAEITYHDGSWQRVEAEATLTILALTADGSVNTVRTGHDIGRTWNNVQELDDPDDAFEIRTPVGTAAVRGTTFATDCPTTDRCAFTVLDGSVRVTPTGGDPVTLTAGEALTVEEGKQPDDPRPADDTDPWITKNQELDAEREGGPPVGGDDPAEVTLAACDAFSAEEAQILAEARDDGRETGAFAVSDVTSFASCSWHSPEPPPDDDGTMEVGIVQLDLSQAATLEACMTRHSLRVTSSGEPLDGVGDEAAWFAAERTVIAAQGGICVLLSHDYSNAGATGQDRFADAAQRILTRVTTAGPQELPAAPATPSPNSGSVSLGS